MAKRKFLLVCVAAAALAGVPTASQAGHRKCDGMRDWFKDMRAGWQARRSEFHRSMAAWDRDMAKWERSWHHRRAR